MSDAARWSTKFVALTLLPVVMLGVYAVACSRPPAPMPPVAASLLVTPYCLPLVVSDHGTDIDTRVCFAVEYACEKLRAAAVAHGQIVGVVSVGACVETR